MKISVITIHTPPNYGSVLQTYATQTLLQSLGSDVEIVNYRRQNNTFDYFVERKLKALSLKKISFLWEKSNLIKKIAKNIVKLFYKKIFFPFNKFLEQRVNFTDKEYFSLEDLYSDTPKADVYLTGSDQVWNSTWNGGIEKPYFLEYAPKGKKRVAFASSIGKSELEEWEVDITREMLSRYDHIGMREKSGVDILGKLNIHSVQVLDPTLMLDKNKWKQIAKVKKNIKPYIFIYQLNKNIDMDNFAEKLAKSKGWEIKRINFATLPCIFDKGSYHYPSVEELLGLMLNSECILNDSFHATAFSLNLNKNFISVLPNAFSTRIKSIVELTGTEHKILKDYADLSIVDREINFNYINEVLDRERESSFEFLKKALDE